MDSREKKQLSETDICDLFITPAIKEAGWDSMQQIRREVTLTPRPCRCARQAGAGNIAR